MGNRKKRLAKLEERARKARADSMRRHVLVCNESDCDKSGEITKRIKHRVALDGLRDTVTVTKVDCLDICEFGPICVVYPEGAWYHDVDDKTADRIVDDHLAKGNVVKKKVFLKNNLR